MGIMAFAGRHGQFFADRDGSQGKHSLALVSGGAATKGDTGPAPIGRPAEGATDSRGAHSS